MKHQRQIIDTFVNSVYVFDDRVVLNFNFTDDAKTVTREEVLGSSAVDNAPPHPQTIRSGDFFVAEVTGREPERAKAGYHRGDGILPFALRDQVRFVRTWSSTLYGALRAIAAYVRTQEKGQVLAYRGVVIRLTV